MPEFTRFSKKNFFSKKKPEMWAKLGQFTIDVIALNFPTELDSIDSD